MAGHVNLCGDKLEDDCEIMSEENNGENKEESERWCE